MTATPAVEPLRCPVCGSPLRGRRDCARCGADLTPWLCVLVAAWRLRVEAAAALAAGDTERALAKAQAAATRHRSACGTRLIALAELELLAGSRVGATARAADDAITTPPTQPSTACTPT